jgi:hypothetical protein
MDFKNAIEIPTTLRVIIKVKCISKRSSKMKLTIGKEYTVTEVSFLRKDRCRVICNTGRNVWYDRILFKE